MTGSTTPSRIPQLFLGLIFGAIFGFLLQKGGVGKYHILMGQLLLDDWTVVKVMGSAVVVGMIGVHALHWLGRVELQVKEAKLGATIGGGLIFGAGFGLSAYCPGTNLAALGQGNWDALAVAAGLLFGSFLFAELKPVVERTVERWGNRGRLAVPDLLPLRERPAVLACALFLAGLLVLLEVLT